MPAMDWFIAQLKYYGRIDAFSFVIRKQAPLEEVFMDLSTTYGTILYLDNKELPKIPENILVLKQMDIAKFFDT